MAKLRTHLAIERAGLVILRLQQNYLHNHHRPPERQDPEEPDVRPTSPVP